MSQADNPSSSCAGEPTPETYQSLPVPSSSRRVQRIADYLSEALDAENPLVANLGAVNADLMHLQYFLRQVIDDALQETAPSLEELEFVMPGIDNLVKITKQIDRFTQLEMKVKAGEQSDRAEARATALSALPPST